MNILIIPSWYTIPESPISGIFFKEQALALQQLFNQTNNQDKVFVVFVENLGIRNLKCYFKRKSFNIQIEDGIPTIRMKILRFPRFHRLNTLRGAKKLRYAIEKASKIWNVSFDLVHIHSALDAGIWYSLSRVKIPYVITEHHTSYSSNTINSVYKKLLPKVFDEAKSIITVGQGLAREISKFTNKKIEIIYNIVSNNFNKNFFETKDKKQFIFFSLGVNAKKKGFDILLLSFKNYIEAGHNGILIIAGLNDSEKTWLLNLDISENVKNHIKLIGLLKREKVFEYMQECDCFILVSRFETFGVAVAEAMYCGKPVIVSKTGGADSYVNESNGIVVPIANIPETTKAITFMEHNYNKYESKKIINFAECNFSPNIVCNKIVEIYKRSIIR